MKNDLNSFIRQIEFNYLYLIDLVKDVEEKQMIVTPAKGLENHPSFTIGHLITAYGMTIKSLGGEYSIPKEWDELFRRKGPGDPRLPNLDFNKYPCKNDLLKVLEQQHEILLDCLNKKSLNQLNESVTWRFSSYFPKKIDVLYFMMINHYAMHISQLAAWRRAMDLPSSLNRL